MVFVKTWAGREEELSCRDTQDASPYIGLTNVLWIVQERIWVRQKRNIIHEEAAVSPDVFFLLVRHQTRLNLSAWAKASCNSTMERDERQSLKSCA